MKYCQTDITSKTIYETHCNEISKTERNVFKRNKGDNSAGPVSLQWVFLQDKYHCSGYFCRTKSIALGVSTGPIALHWVFLQDESYCSESIYLKGISIQDQSYCLRLNVFLLKITT